METIVLNLSMTTVIICIFTMLLWLLENKTAFGDINPLFRKIIIGLAFGGISVFSTHVAVQYNDFTLNVCDAAPLCAGLMFNPLSGVIAGIIGGVEHFIAGQLFDIGSFTNVACSLSMVLAGFHSALLRKFLLEGKKPTPFYAFSIGAVMEVFHMLAILLTHMDTISEAFTIVRQSAAPMIFFTATAIMLSSVFISLFSGQYRRKKHRLNKETTPITKTFQVWLLVFVTAAFLLTFTFTYTAQTRLTLSNAQTLLELNAKDIKREIDKNDKNLVEAKNLLNRQALASARAVANDVAVAQTSGSLSREHLMRLAEEYDIYIIEVINSNGIITDSTDSSHLGFDMKLGEQSKEFMVLVNGNITELLQDFQPISYNSSVNVMYAGVSIPNGFIQVGYNSDDISKFSSLADISGVTADRHIGRDGYAILSDEDNIVVSGENAFVGKKLSELGFPASYDEEYFYCEVNGVSSYCLVTNAGNYTVYLVLPIEELYENRNIFAYATAFMDILLFSSIFILIFQLVKTIIVKNLHKVNESLTRITGGNLAEKVDVRTNAEFASLSYDINSTVDTLKRYISEAEARIDKELEFAKTIQLSALPNMSQPFMNRREFSLSAQMTTAKEVGGDFYDYFFVDNNHLALIIADVSGKGIPASLFMMKSKTLIKSLAETGIVSPKEILETANKELCEGNDAEMFVTAWLGILEIDTGKMTCSNAGHEYPVICRKDGKYELFHDKHGFVLAGMSMTKYHEYNIQFFAGDSLFVYTDGVVEATNSKNELFGTERMLSALNIKANATPEEQILAVKDCIDDFVGVAPQFDDITMLSLNFKGEVL